MGFAFLYEMQRDHVEKSFLNLVKKGGGEILLILKSLDIIVVFFDKYRSKNTFIR